MDDEVALTELGDDWLLVVIHNGTKIESVLLQYISGWDVYSPDGETDPQDEPPKRTW